MSKNEVRFVNLDLWDVDFLHDKNVKICYDFWLFVYTTAAVFEPDNTDV